jgi:hypothetical protein
MYREVFVVSTPSANRQPARGKQSFLRQYVKTVVPRQRGEEAIIARCREPFTTKVFSAIASSLSEK